MNHSRKFKTEPKLLLQVPRFEAGSSIRDSSQILYYKIIDFIANVDIVGATTMPYHENLNLQTKNKFYRFQRKKLITFHSHHNLLWCIIRPLGVLIVNPGIT